MRSLARPLTRRQVMKVLGGGITGLGLTPVILGRRPAHAQPRAGGRLIVSQTGAQRNLDPAKQTNADDGLMAYQVFETLVHYDADGSLKPSLAERWEKSADLKTWTFHLRKGIKFHHGKEMGAEDVKVSLDRVLDPKTGSILRASLQVVESVTVSDPYTVRLILKAPYSELDAVLSHRRASIIAKDKVDVLSKEASGTGPFKLKETVQGDHATFVKNPDYWRRGLPYLDEVVFKTIPEAATRLTSLRNGESDIFWQVPFDLVEQLKGTRGVQLGEITTNGWDGLFMHVQKKPFDDPRVRKAIRLACNKEQLIKVCLRGHGQRVVLPLLPNDPLYPSHVKDLDQNYDEARKLLTQAGYPNGFEIPMYIGIGRPQREAMSEVVCDMLKPLNVRCRIQRMPIDKFFADIEFKGEFYVDGWFGDPGADMHLYPNFRTGGPWNVAQWSNAEADRVLEATRSTASVEERRKLYGRLADLLNEDGPAVIPWVFNHIVAFRDRVKGFRVWSDQRVWLGEAWVEG